MVTSPGEGGDLDVGLTSVKKIVEKIQKKSWIRSVLEY
jgi:hypothetical protein